MQLFCFLECPLFFTSLLAFNQPRSSLLYFKEYIAKNSLIFDLSVVIRSPRRWVTRRRPSHCGCVCPPVTPRASRGAERVAAVQVKGSVRRCCPLGVKLGSVWLLKTFLELGFFFLLEFIKLQKRKHLIFFCVTFLTVPPMICFHVGLGFWMLLNELSLHSLGTLLCY